MELGSIVGSLQNKTILVTGASGFLAKIFLEKILRMQPNIKKLYLLLKASETKSATERLEEEVIGYLDLFKVLREKYRDNLYSFVSEKVIPISGNVSIENLGVKDSLFRNEMWKEIDFVVNFAATTKFDERYDVALATNTFGALHLLNFAKKCLKMKMLVHVSTAYVCGEDGGLLLESPFSMGEAKKGTNKIDINGELKLVQQQINNLKSKNFSEEAITFAMKDFGTERAKLYGWPNAYVFTKAMGEMLVVNLKDNVPLIIVRPAVVTSTWKEPFPGWIEGLRTSDRLLEGYASGKFTSFVFNPYSIVDEIPADMVVNGIITGMAVPTNQHKDIVYHLGSSLRNPLSHLNFRDIGFRYFSRNPWINKDGKPLRPRKWNIWTTMSSFRIYMAVRYQIPLKALYLLNLVTFQQFKDTYNLLDRKLKRMKRLLVLYEPYLFFKGIFDDTNAEKLRKIAREKFSDAEAFNFDPKDIEWEDYMVNAHIPGLVKYAMKN